MEEILRLLRENNLMLQFLCNYIMREKSPKRKNSEDLKNFMTNLVADWYSGRILGRGNNNL